MSNGEEELLGSCVFITWNGLQVDGSGVGSGLSSNAEPVEFRDGALGGLEYLPRGDLPALFLRKLLIRKRGLLMLGFVTRQNDVKGRPGFAGIGVFVPADSDIATSALSKALDLYESFKDYISTLVKKEESFSRLNYFKPEGQSVANISLPVTGPPRLFANPRNELDQAFVRALLTYLSSIDHQTGTVIVGLGPDKRYRPFSMEDLKSVRAARKDWERQVQERAQQEKQKREEQLARKFVDRGARLGKSRPHGITPEFEEYFVDLILYVLKAKGVIEPNDKPSIDPVDPFSGSLLGKLSRKK